MLQEQRDRWEKSQEQSKDEMGKTWGKESGTGTLSRGSIPIDGEREVP